MDENSFMASLNAVWLLYDGGMRKGYREQTRAGIEAAKQELRRTELEITDRNKEGWTVGVGIELPLFEGFLTRIFQHGFTTRKEGHGFGLHSDALAAKELGGSLTAHRDGPGTGATFTLELPVQKRAANTARAQGAEPAGLQLEAA
jgi:signal transduction histidine kinase